ncbi:MAG: hypothetical protein KHZ62_05175 [Clostridiales bacterium]|nr:hypothetical protein [Clostridiales bacterium]
MIQISEVNIISIDKGEDSWAIEGEILFEEDLSSAFEVTYVIDDDELEDLSLEIDPGDFDAEELKEKIKIAANEYDE